MDSSVWLRIGAVVAVAVVAIVFLLRRKPVMPHRIENESYNYGMGGHDGRVESGQSHSGGHSSAD